MPEYAFNGNCTVQINTISQACNLKDWCFSQVSLNVFFKTEGPLPAEQYFLKFVFCNDKCAPWLNTPCHFFFYNTLPVSFNQTFWFWIDFQDLPMVLTVFDGVKIKAHNFQNYNDLDKWTLNWTEAHLPITSADLLEPPCNHCLSICSRSSVGCISLLWSNSPTVMMMVFAFALYVGTISCILHFERERQDHNRRAELENSCHS